MSSSVLKKIDSRILRFVNTSSTNTLIQSTTEMRREASKQKLKPLNHNPRIKEKKINYPTVRKK